jgi:hypothetical protein
MNCFPVFIDLWLVSSFTGLLQIPQIGKYDDSEAVMERPQRANHQIAQETGRPEWGSIRGMCKRPLKA